LFANKQTPKIFNLTSDVASTALKEVLSSLKLPRANWMDGPKGSPTHGGARVTVVLIGTDVHPLLRAHKDNHNQPIELSLGCGISFSSCLQVSRNAILPCTEYPSQPQQLYAVMHAEPDRAGPSEDAKHQPISIEPRMLEFCRDAAENNRTFHNGV
jgi:hypothetical protein